MILSPYLSRGSSNFDEICCAHACFDSENAIEWSPDEKSKFCIFKMADGRRLEYCNLATSRRIFVRLEPKLAWRSWITHRHRSCDQNSKFRKFKMTDACHFENVYAIWHVSGNKTVKINVKTVVYLQLIKATWHTENSSKNDERRYFFVVLMAVLLFCCPTALLQ